MIIFHCKINKALEISEYLKSQGLKYDQDYSWNRVNQDLEGNGQYYFTCVDRKYETMIALKFS